MQFGYSSKVNGVFPNGDSWSSSNSLQFEELEELSGNNTFSTYEEGEVFYAIQLESPITTDFVRHLLYVDGSQSNALDLFTLLSP